MSISDETNKALREWLVETSNVLEGQRSWKAGEGCDPRTTGRNSLKKFHEGSGI